jgi:hypothetical protein
MFDYGTSILNPTLKLIIAFGYLAVIYFYYQCVREYKGSAAGSALKALLYMGIFGFLAALTRYFGHGVEFGFDKELSLKWLQSFFYLLQAVFFITAAIFFMKSSQAE